MILILILFVVIPIILQALFLAIIFEKYKEDITEEDLREINIKLNQDNTLI